MKNYLVLMLVAMAAVAHAGKVYTYKDASGKTVYSDNPPPDARDVKLKKLGGNVIDTSGYPYELQQAIKNFPVVLWGTTCGPICDKAAQHLKDRGVPYVGKDPSSSAEQIEAFKKLTGGNSVPVLQVGAKLLNAYNAAEWDAALNVAGYPKTPVPGARPPAASAP